MIQVTLMFCLTILAGVFSVACKADLTDGNAFTGGGSQQRPFGSPPRGATSSDATNKAIIKGKYLLRVALHPITDAETSQVPTLEGLTAASKGCLCVGAVYLNIKSDFSLEFPNSKAKCSLIGEMDLEKLLNGMGDKERKSAPESDGRVMRFPKLGSMSFSPARPVLVGPIAQDLTKFQGYRESNRYHVSYEDEDTKKVTESDGQIALNILEAGGSWTPPFMPNAKFEDIIRYEMLTTGFPGVPHKKGLLFDRVEFILNSRPISIARITLQGKASDLLPSKPGELGGAGGGTGGGASGMSQSPLVKFFSQFFTVYIQLDATEFKAD